jgi:uncharacterized protein with PIN domain
MFRGMTKLDRPIPSKIEYMLMCLGISAVPDGEWLRVRDSRTTQEFASRKCQHCEQPVVMFPANIGRRPVFIGQCKACQAIYWQERTL